MASTTSPSHALASTNAEQLSTTDDTPYAAIYVESRTGNSADVHTGGPEVTPTAGGHLMKPEGGFWFGPASNIVYRLTQIYAAGANGDIIDTICIKAGAIL
jgi:hypothetical protein